MKHAVAENSTSQYLVILVIGATVGYQAVLCLINTNLFPVSWAMVAAGELVILLACLPFLLPRIPPQVAVVAALSGATLCLLALLQGKLDIKAFRDLLIPLWFYWLGRNIGSPRLADKALKTVLVVVLAFGFFELLATDTYTRVFDIFGYYVNIGSLNEITEYTRDSRLQLNGIRPEGIGRTLLPWLLDNHRVSSLFLEPVSLGNFATVVAAWGLSKDRQEIRQTLFFLGAAIVLIVLADSRFALLSVGLLIAMRVLMHGKAFYLPVLLPLVIVPALLGLSILSTGSYGDDFMGRLIVSGEALQRFDAATLLGYRKVSSFPDHGYAYVLSTFGVVLAVALWLILWFIPMPDGPAERFRSFTGVYIALILCVSGTSLFALKSAGALWFLLGCTLRDPATAKTPQDSSVKTRANKTNRDNDTSYSPAGVLATQVPKA